MPADPPNPELELVEEIGSGAVASVWRARDTSGREVAVKVLHERHERDPTAAARFTREAALATSIRHANVVEVHGQRPVGGRPALVMELVEGESLAEAIAREAPLPEARILEIARGIAEGLEAAHSRGVVHRDLKPANVLLAGSVPKIADFGMARAASIAGVDPSALTVLGTPSYMAPESMEPLSVDARTDLYALGCILHEMATGEPPYSAPTSFAVIEAHRKAEVPELPSDYSEGLRQLVRRLLSKQPGERPQGAATVREAVDALRGGATSLAMRDVEDHAGGRCAGCGEPVLEGVRACLNCGLPFVRLAPGPFAVFVVGPGKPTSKLPSSYRESLLRWLADNEAIGLDMKRLEREIPRLPFPLVVGVDQWGAQSLARSLEGLGFHTAVRRGGRFAHESVPYKLTVQGGRVMGILAAAAAAPAILYPPLVVLTFGVLMCALPAVAAVVTVRQSAPASALRKGTSPRELPAALDEELREIEQTVARLGPRHRGALRAVVQRVVSVVRSETDPAILEELRGALSWANAAAHRLEELDRWLAQSGVDPADATYRAVLHERDTWSGRLLGVTARLESLAARHARENQRAALAERAEISEVEDEALAELRASVEALEEIAERSGGSAT